jgi:hypothetical protein
MRRWRAWRALAAVLAAACFGLAGGRAANPAQPPGLLSDAQLEKVKRHVQDAIRFEENALKITNHDQSRKVAGLLGDSLGQLQSARATLSGHDLGGLDPAQHLADAEKQDTLAIDHIPHTPPNQDLDVGRQISVAIGQKEAALRLLLRVPTTGAGAPTTTAEATPGTEPGTVILGVTASAPVNALRVVDQGRGTLTEKGGPSGWNCTNSVRGVLSCRGRAASNFTLLIADTRPAPNLLVSGSKDGGRRFAPLARVTTPVLTTLTLTCPPTAPKGQSIVVSGTLTPPDPGATITNRWTLADGTVITHTSTTDSQSSWRDAISDYRAGLVHSQAFFAGDGKVRPAQSPDCTTSYAG